MLSLCCCGSKKEKVACCEAILSGKKPALTPEALMRSRYVAYKTRNYHYIFSTYAQEQQDHLSIHAIQQSAEGTDWLSLLVVNSHFDKTFGQVEFKAYYRFDEKFFLLHEVSDFVLENESWRYTSGKLLSDDEPLKLGRNQQCLCGSGKKFKRCCST